MPGGDLSDPHHNRQTDEALPLQYWGPVFLFEILRIRTRSRICGLIDEQSSSAFPSYISGVHHLDESFVYVTNFVYFNPTIEVVTFRLRGWCMLGVFLLPAFTHLGHQYQDLLSLYDGMHVCTSRPRFILSFERVLGEWSQNPR